MPTKAKKRRTVSSIKVNRNVRCQRIYPVNDKAGKKMVIPNLKTVGIKLSRAQAIHLARVLLLATQEWEDIDITAWRFDRRKSDDQYRLTVTSAVAGK